jgi:hypothetical protein
MNKIILCIANSVSGNLFDFSYYIVQSPNTIDENFNPFLPLRASLTEKVTISDALAIIQQISVHPFL